MTEVSKLTSRSLLPSTASACSERDGRQLRSYPARFHVLAIFSILGLINQIMYLSFSSIPQRTSLRYQVSEFLVTTIAIECVVLYLPGAYLTARILASKDLRAAVLIGSALQLVGAVLRLLADTCLRPASPHAGYALLLLGQGLAALAAPAFMNTPVLLAEAWFNEHQREAAVACGILSPLLGEGVGSALSSFIVTGHSGEGTALMLAIQVALAAFSGLWALLAFSSMPPTPPSCIARGKTVTPATGSDSPPAVAGGNCDAPRQSTVAIWCLLLRRPQFLLLLSVFVAGASSVTVVLILLAQIVGPCGYGSSVVGITSVLFMVGGIFGSLASGAVMGATQAYRPMLRISVFAAAIMSMAFLLCIQPGHTIRLYVAAILNGVCMVGTLPVLLTNAAEESYPIPSDASTALLWTSAILFQVPFTPLAQAVLLSEGQQCGGWLSPFHVLFYGMAIFFCLIPVFFYNGQYRRFEAERALTAADAEESSST